MILKEQNCFTKIFMLFLSFSSFLVSTPSASIQPEQPCSPATFESIMSNVVTMTDDIAELIIVGKQEKDPKKIKVIALNIIKAISNLVEIIIEKRRLKKLNRSISIESFDFASVSSQSIHEEIEETLNQIVQKVRLYESTSK